MKSMSEYASLVEKEIKQLNLPVMNLPGLYDPISYAMDAGGKRLRPVLMLMTADAYGFDLGKVMRPAVGIEMFHNFTLLHDDVMDNSDTRRGRPTIHKKWDTNTAILAGDAMLTLSNYLMSEVAESKLPQVLDTFNKASMQIYEGQMRDMDFETSDNVSLSDYMLMIEQKTGALLGAATKIGAQIAGASHTDAQCMYDFGIELGKAFQIQDDYLDVYGDAATFGKPIGGDILNGKKTFLLLKAYETSGALKDALTTAMAMPASESKIRTVRNLYTKMGMEEICNREIASLCSKAINAIKETSMPEDAKTAFKGLVDKLINRKK